MSEAEDTPAQVDIVDVDVRQWVAAAKSNPFLYRARCVTEIVLTSIGVAPDLKKALVLKGGTLMALAFKSNRITGDVDFTSQAEPEGFGEMLRAELDVLMPKTAIQLGYADLICRVQTVKKMPKALNFAEHDFPALLVRIASAQRGTNEVKRLEDGQATSVVDIEISFRDQVYSFQELNLFDAGVAVQAFSIHEIISEKFRALLQQVPRNRYRRQDVFDIAYLIGQHHLSSGDRQRVLTTFIDKCKTRSITPSIDSLDDPELARRAEADWKTLALEVTDLPRFDGQFALVRDLYRSLPWQT